MNIAEKLDSMRNGAQKVVVLVNNDLIDVRKALDEGDFKAAARAAAFLSHRLGKLSSGESAFCALDENDVIKVRNVDVGEVIVSTSDGKPRVVERVEFCDDDDTCLLFFKDEDGDDVPVRLRLDQELLVRRDAE